MLLSNTAMHTRLSAALCAAQTSTKSKPLQSTITGVPARPLSYTCYLNKADSARQLIAHGADVNQDAGLNSPTPLMYACQNNNAALAALLIARGADVDKRTLSQSGFSLALQYGDKCCFASCGKAALTRIQRR